MSKTTPIKITVLLFGRAREIAANSSLDIELASPATVEDAFAALKGRFPALAGMERSLLFAVNEEYAARGQALSNRDTLAVLPPVSGGDGTAFDLFELTHE